jgi:hypothetical protein
VVRQGRVGVGTTTDHSQSLSAEVAAEKAS